MDLPPSNFISGDPYAAHWNYREPPVDNVCATQGAGFLARLYAAVGVDPMIAWGSELQSALITKATLLASSSASPAGWTPLINALRADLASSRTSAVGHRFGIYLAYYEPSNRRLDAISLSPGTILLQWGVPPQDDRGLNGGAIACIDSSDPQVFTASMIGDSSTGIRTGEGRAVPPGQNTLPNAGIITAGGLITIGLVAIGAWWLFGGPRENPSLSREEIDELRTCRQRCEHSAFGKSW